MLRALSIVALTASLCAACDPVDPVDAGPDDGGVDAAFDAPPAPQDDGGQDGGTDGGSDSGPSDAGPSLALDAPCEAHDRCESGVCGAADGAGVRRCTEACTDADACVAGWTCAAIDGAMGCACTAGAEACDGADGDCDRSIDEGDPAALCGGGDVCSDGLCCDPSAERVDVLFMVDGSNSMAEEQASLAAELPRFVEALTTGDLDGDGAPDAAPAGDLHLGVITADMGVGGATVPTCAAASYGDDGVLRTAGRVDITGCAATYPSFLEFQPGGTSTPADVATDLACVAQVGTGGCGFEQQLEAVLKATTPSTSATRFVGGTTGHADGANAGFLRADSVFVAVMLTDENDCSALDPDVFDPSSSTYTADLNLRCWTYPSALHPLDRYVNGILALRSDARDLVFAPIVGIPVDLEGETYAAILSDARMVERIDPSASTRLAPSCNVPGRGLAFPPRRIVEVARDLDADGATVSLGSICQSSYALPADAVLARVAERRALSCGAP